MPTNTRPILTSLLVLSISVGIAGCSSRPTMQELEQEAEQTGDWSEVEKRQRMDRAMGRVETDPVCPEGMILRCSTKGERELCDCIWPHVLRKF